MDSSNTTDSERHSSSSVYTNKTELALHESVFSSFYNSEINEQMDRIRLY
jgi:hypothetical protein